MTATDELRALLDERGVEHFDHEEGEPLRDLSEAGPDPATSWLIGNASVCAVPNKNGTFDLWIDHVTPEQAIAATLGRGTCRKVYLVETSDDLLESWYPIAVYLHRESAEDCAEALRKEEDGIRQFARVSELRVVDG